MVIVAVNKLLLNDPHYESPTFAEYEEDIERREFTLYDYTNRVDMSDMSTKDQALRIFMSPKGSDLESTSVLFSPKMFDHIQQQRILEMMGVSYAGRSANLLLRLCNSFKGQNRKDIINIISGTDDDDPRNGGGFREYAGDMMSNAESVNDEEQAIPDE